MLAVSGALAGNPYNVDREFLAKGKRKEMVYRES